MNAAKHTPAQARQWLQAFSEAEQRKSDSTLPMDARIRSAETCALLLRAADNAGESFESLAAIAKATGSAQ